MHTYSLSFRSILAIGFIFICTAGAWFILGGALTHRSIDRSGSLQHQVVETWGPELRQTHPVVWYRSQAGSGAGNRNELQPSASENGT